MHRPPRRCLAHDEIRGEPAGLAGSTGVVIELFLLYLRNTELQQLADRTATARR
jgi:hypothetical protein